VLTQEKSNRSTINCFTGTPNPTLTKGGGPQPGGMGPMPGMGGPPGPPAPQPLNGQQPPVMPTPITTPIQAPSPTTSETPPPTATPRYTTLYKPVKATQLVCKKGSMHHYRKSLPTWLHKTTFKNSHFICKNQSHGDALISSLPTLISYGFKFLLCMF